MVGADCQCKYGDGGNDPDASLKWLRRERMKDIAVSRMKQVGVRTNAIAESGRFSGGNQQRILLGRSLALHPRVLLLNDFTRGVDVKAKAAIHRLVA